MRKPLPRGLLGVVARDRPPEIAEVAQSADWQFETRALADDFAKFEVTALASDRPTISIFDYIGDDGYGGGVTEQQVADAMRDIGDRPLLVEINSPGGNYFAGIAIYNILRRHTQAVEVQILGCAASAASVIAMAGDSILIAHNAEVMIHQASGLFFGTAEDADEAAALLRKLDTAMADTYAARTGKERDPIMEWMRAETVFTGQEAVDQGFADALMEREAQPVVYASAADYPTDRASLDKFLAKKLKMPRSQRRQLFSALKNGTHDAATPATPNAGPSAESVSRALRALAVPN